MILGIDPGSESSAYVIYESSPRAVGKVTSAVHLPNQKLLDLLRYSPPGDNGVDYCCLAVEMIESFGKPVGREVFQTVVWIGRFIEAWDRQFGDDRRSLIYRSQVKLALCNSRAAKDSFVRQALLDKFGPGKRAAVGLKRSPGPLYGVSGHCWQALAVAVTAEILEQEKASVASA